MKLARLVPGIATLVILASSPTWAGTQPKPPSRPVPCSPTLVSAVERGDVPSIAAELDAGASVRCADNRGSTLLHWLVIAWTEGDEDEPASRPVANLLIARGADASALDATGKTPLMMACVVQNIGAVQGLLAAGANPNAAGPDSSSALEYALRSGDPDIVTALLRGRANPNQRISGKGLPLISAVTLGSPKLVELLLRAGADPNLASAMGQSAVDQARSSKNASMVTLLKKPVPPEEKLKTDPASGSDE